MLKNLLLKYLFNAITEKDVIKFNEKTRQLFINKELIGKEELDAIKEEIKLITGSRIWALLQGTLEEQAKKKIFIDSKVIEDVVFGKAMLYNLDVQDKIFKIIEKI